MCFVAGHTAAVLALVVPGVWSAHTAPWGCHRKPEPGEQVFEAACQLAVGTANLDP